MGIYRRFYQLYCESCKPSIMGKLLFKYAFLNLNLVHNYTTVRLSLLASDNNVQILGGVLMTNDNVDSYQITMSETVTNIEVVWSAKDL